MNIEKANFPTIIRFGSITEFKQKLDMEKRYISEVINMKDENGMTLLEISLASRKFDISKYLLENQATVNNVTNEGYNEFHYLAANINSNGALDIGYLLLNRGTSLNHKDIKYGNTAFFSLCNEAFKSQIEETMLFICDCFEKIDNVDEQNKSGISIRQLINERGSDKLKRIMEEKYA